MKRKQIIFIILVIAGFTCAAFTLWKGVSGVAASRSFTIVKAWRPVWDVFQIGVTQRESTIKSFGTTFLQKGDYGSALNAFQEGKADAATLTTYEAILAASRGIPLKIVLLLDYTIGSDGLVAKLDNSSLLDLKGKRIGVEKGTVSHFTVLKALEKAGLDKKEVQLVNYGLDGLQKAFLQDEVDAVAIYEPYMSELARQGSGHILFSSQEMPRAICDVLFVRDEVARDHHEVIDHWVAAWGDALNFKERDPENCLRALNRLNRTPIPVLKEAFQGIFCASLRENRMAFGTPESPGYLLDSLRDMEQFMFEEGVIMQRLPLQNLLGSRGSQKIFSK